jgi:hypothetical protein
LFAAKISKDIKTDVGKHVLMQRGVRKVGFQRIPGSMQAECDHVGNLEMKRFEKATHVAENHHPLVLILTEDSISGRGEEKRGEERERRGERREMDQQ